jgi:hypothetical protein
MVVLLVLVAVTIHACSLTQPQMLSIQPTQPPPTSEPVEIDPLATVTFQVEVPVDTPPGQPVMLSLLDEVTGLG